jgi:hypothetical protein
MGYPVDDQVLEDACAQINKGRLYNADYARPYQELIPDLAAHPLMQQLGYSYQIAEEAKEAAYEH